MHSETLSASNSLPSLVGTCLEGDFRRCSLLTIISACRVANRANHESLTKIQISRFSGNAGAEECSSQIFETFVGPSTCWSGSSSSKNPGLLYDSGFSTGGFNWIIDQNHNILTCQCMPAFRRCQNCGALRLEDTHIHPNTDPASAAKFGSQIFR